ncbi:uncharacterized protein EAE98_006064 [Botrytis deweyae]|uniref:Uncharacterized protein n=1 Tax=Botrytis deweyae TaxID=2478750 RepID=A0ABQ7ILS0_9HELO|nr:uncharacterized protein EAE98_006064 [Botrytis deweyae]KAF7927682.1 hypothetical protein EAE98_006064 [Botrytis deweyae]
MFIKEQVEDVNASMVEGVQFCQVALTATPRWNSPAVELQRSFSCFDGRARTNGTTFRVPDFALGHKINFIFLRSSNFQNINNYDNYGNKTITMKLKTLDEMPQRRFR